MYVRVCVCVPHVHTHTHTHTRTHTRIANYAWQMTLQLFVCTTIDKPPAAEFQDNPMLYLLSDFKEHKHVLNFAVCTVYFSENMHALGTRMRACGSGYTHSSAKNTTKFGGRPSTDTDARSDKASKTHPASGRELSDAMFLFKQ